MEKSLPPRRPSRARSAVQNNKERMLAEPARPKTSTSPLPTPLLRGLTSRRLQCHIRSLKEDYYWVKINWRK